MFVVVSRQILIDSRFPTVICAPVYDSYDGLSTQVPVGTEQGLKRDSSIHCDELVCLAKSTLANFIGAISCDKLQELNRSLLGALELA